MRFQCEIFMQKRVSKGWKGFREAADSNGGRPGFGSCTSSCPTTNLQLEAEDGYRRLDSPDRFIIQTGLISVSHGVRLHHSTRSPFVAMKVLATVIFY